MFYLPYRVACTRDQLLAAYPRMEKWLHAKNKYDPEGRFVSEWFIRIVEIVRGETEADVLRGALPPAPDIPRNEPNKSYVFRGRSFDLFPQLIASFTQLLDRLDTKAYAENAELADRLQTFLPVESSAERLKSVLSQSALFYHTRKGRDPKAPVHLDHAVYEQLKQHYHGSLYARMKSQITSLCILCQTHGQIGGEMKELLALRPDKGRSTRRIGDHGRSINVLASATQRRYEGGSLHRTHRQRRECR
jgi:hypothetical protein